MFSIKSFFFKNKVKSFFSVKTKIKLLFNYFFNLNFFKKSDFFSCENSYFLDSFIFYKKFYRFCNNFSKYLYFNKKNLLGKFFFFKKNYKILIDLKKKTYKISNKPTVVFEKNTGLVTIKPNLISKDIPDKNYFNSFFFLRKTKIFNKGRYSRNRQLYKTGVYLCLYINIIVVYAVYFLYYRFIFNFGYFWLFLFFCFFSFFFSRFFKYNFFSRFKIELYNYFNWISFLIYNTYLYFNYFFLKIYNFFKIIL